MTAKSHLRNPVRNILSSCVAIAMGVTSYAHAATHSATNTNDSGANSLRQAILDANADISTPVVVDATTVSGTITLSTGQLAITNGMAVQGPGAGQLTIDGNHASRIFYVNAGSQNVTISGLKVAYGTSSAKGGGVFISAGTGAVVTLSNSVISGNSASTGGGGIYATGVGSSIYLQSMQVVGNESYAEGGGIMAYFPGGVTKFSVVDSTISGNVAQTSGGGISFYKLAGYVYMNHTLVSANETIDFTGGGLRMYASGESTAAILNSTFSGNSAAGIGGGIALEGLVSTNITNTTVVANSAGGSSGGGGILSSSQGTDTTTIESSTITNNSANIAGGVLMEKPSNQVTLHNTVVANNSASTGDPDTSGFFAANYNFIRNPGGATLIGANNNVSGADPLLGSLGNYGGPTPTKLPLAGSPLIDAGDAADDSQTGGDQRGLTRVVGVHIDIGAVEVQAPEDTIFLDTFAGY
jgi:predicted outer membrane repeat protein